MAPALMWKRQLASLTLGDIRNAGFASEVRIAATRDLPAAGVRSGIGHYVGSAPGARRVSRASAGGPAHTGPCSGFEGCFPLPVGGDRSVLPRAPRRGHRRRARARDRRERVGLLPPRGHPICLAGDPVHVRSEEHTSELQSLAYLVCRLLLEKKKNEKH